MNFIKRFLDFILFGNIFVAAGASCLIYSTSIQLKNNHSFFYSALVFFATLFIYNGQRIFYKPQHNKSLHSVRRQWIFKNQKTIKMLASLGFAGVCITYFFNDLKIVFYLSPLLFLSIAYFFPAIKLRKNAVFKLLTLTIVWTFVTAIVPVLLSKNLFWTTENILHIFLRFFFMLGICMPFDIRDLEIDKADDVKTLPHILGENTTRWIAFLFMLIYNTLIILEYHIGMIQLNVFIALIVSGIINSLVVFFTTSKRSEYFFVAGLDGTMILQGLMLFLVSFL